MWKDSIRNIVVIFQPNIVRIVGFYVRHLANDKEPCNSVQRGPQKVKNSVGSPSFLSFKVVSLSPELQIKQTMGKEAKV